MERSAWPKNLSSRGKQAIKELLDGQNPTKKIRHLFDAHSQTGNNTAQPLFGEDLIVSVLGSFSNTLSSSSSAAESYEVSQVPTNACVRSEVSEGSESIKFPLVPPNACVASEVSEGSESSHIPAAALPAGPFYQQRLQTLIESTSRWPWIYAIFWQSSSDGYHASASAVPVLGWGDGYYKGEEDKSKGKAKISASAAEQEHRKRVLRDLNSLIAGPSAIAPDDAVDEEVTDTEWFFLVSMMQSFGNDGSLPGQAHFNRSPIWVSGGDRLEDCGCERAKQGRIFGLQTMVCVPVIGGVVELGSTELIFQSSDLMNMLKNVLNLPVSKNYFLAGGRKFP